MKIGFFIHPYTMGQTKISFTSMETTRNMSSNIVVDEVS